MGLVFGAILPHGPDIVPELAADPGRMAETRAAMERAGGRMAAARPETVVLLDPHAPFLEPGLLAVGTGARAAGAMEGPGGRRIDARYRCDAPLADAVLRDGRDDFPLRRAEPPDGVVPLSWGAMIPLWFTVRAHPEPRPEVVVIAPGPAVPRETLLRFGGLLAGTALRAGKRVALVASADQGHTHDAAGLFGYSPASARHDALYCRAVSEQRLDLLLEIGDDLLREAWVDSFWQTLVLMGALQATPMTVDLLSYAVPTYYGMAVAIFEPR